VGSGHETSHKLAYKSQPLWSPTEGEVVGTVSQRVKEAHCATSIPHVLLHEEHLRRDNLPLPLDPSLLLFLILGVLCRKTWLHVNVITYKPCSSPIFCPSVCNQNKKQGRPRNEATKFCSFKMSPNDTFWSTHSYTLWTVHRGIVLSPGPSGEGPGDEANRGTPLGWTPEGSIGVKLITIWPSVSARPTSLDR